jgi:hypothetical protein
MLAMIFFGCPPQRVQLSISTPNTRFRRRAQLIATCRGVDGWVGSAPDTGGVAAPRPRCAGVTAENFGLGERIQLTYEVPYVPQTSTHAPLQSGRSNAYPGIKWRFLDQREEGWQMSIFPQLETAGGAHARSIDLTAPGQRVFLPVEAARKVGPVDVDVEAGYYFPGHGPRERILGLAVGRAVTDRLEFDAEIYDDRVFDAPPQSTTVDVGARYKLRPGIIALFMAGRSISGFGQGQPEFMGYVGVQLLLEDYGRAFNTEL